MHTNADLRVILPCHAYRRCVRWHRLRVMRQNHVPVVAHPLIQNLVNRILLKTFLDYLFKGFKVSIFEEDLVASIATIQGVIDLASKVRAESTGHDISSKNKKPKLSKPSNSRPFCQIDS